MRSGSSSNCATGSARSTAPTPRDDRGITAVAPWRDQLAHALAGLGFSGKEAADAIDVVAADLPGGQPDVSALFRRSIQLLGRTR